MYCDTLQKHFENLADAEVLSKKLLEQLCRLSNSVNYCSLIFSDWSEEIPFLQMQYEKEYQQKQKNHENFKIEDTESYLYEKPVQIFNKLLEKSLQGLSSAIANSFQVYSSEYFNNNR